MNTLLRLFPIRTLIMIVAEILMFIARSPSAKKYAVNLYPFVVKLRGATGQFLKRIGGN